EQTQTAIAALHRHLNDLGITVREKLARHEQARLGLLGAQGSAEMFSEETSEMTQAASTKLGQLFGGMIDDLLFGHLLDELAETMHGISALGRRRFVPTQIFGKERHR